MSFYLRKPMVTPRRTHALIIPLCLLLCGATPPANKVTTFLPGDLVRVTRSETLMFKGKNLAGAPKGQEFSVLKYDGGQRLVFVGFYKDDGLIAVTLPADALELSPPDPWADLFGGAEAFRDQRYEQSRKLLARAAQDGHYRALAGVLSNRTVGATNAVALARSNGPTGQQAFANTLLGLRESAAQAAQAGFLSVAVAIDEGADRLAAQVPGIPAVPEKIDREELSKRVAISNRSVIRCRQAMAVHRLMEATKYIEEGLAAEPGRPELKAMQARTQKEIQDAEESYEAADRMKRFEKGAIHALTALDRGLKYCADHPRLLALKVEMQSLFEARTSPPVTPALLKASGKEGAAKSLEEGRKLYVDRCTECHELELLDSRSISGWRDAVASMSRRANLESREQAQILEYLSAAQRGMDSE